MKTKAILKSATAIAGLALPFAFVGSAVAQVGSAVQNSSTVAAG